MAEPSLPEEEEPREWTGPGRHEYQTAGVTDSATSRDTLGFGPYVRAMATFLTNPRTKGPLTISIEGEWGSGKSSFMLQLKKMLAAAASEWSKTTPEPVNAPIIVWFNAWRNDKAEELWGAFALSILKELSSRLRLSERWKAHWRLVKLRFNWSEGWWDFVRFLAPLLVLVLLFLVLPVLVYFDKIRDGDLGTAIVEAVTTYLGYSIFAYLAALLPAILWVNDSLGNPFSVDLKKHVTAPDYNARVSFIEQFHDDFSKILDAYVPKDHKVVCFIDDLDRCDVPKAAELMQAINLMLLTDERMIFLLGMDRQKVAAGLAVKFKDLIPFLPEPGLQAVGDASHRPGPTLSKGLWFGHDFIEKFVQIAYSLPRPAPDNLDRFFQDLVGSSAPARGTTRNKPRWWKSAFTWLLGWLSKTVGRLHVGRQPPTDPVAGTPQTGQGAELPDPALNDQVAPDDEAKREQQKELVRVVELVESENDPEILSELVDVVAPAFDYNPRRLKQFVNLFRLNLATAAATRLLYTEQGREASGIRLEQLGKFVSLGIRWPDLIPWLARDPTNRLKELCEKAYAKGDWVPPIQVNRPGRLRQLLKAGCFDSNDIRFADAGRWGLETIDLRTLLAVSPAAPPAPMRTESGVGSVGIEVTAEGVGKTVLDEGEYVLIPAGRFKMGAVPGDESANANEKPQHDVEITDAFLLKKTLVTVLEYKRFAEKTGREMPEAPAFNPRWNEEDHPIVNVSWEEAISYCRDAGGRLPTEAEWEYAARGGAENLTYPNGNNLSSRDAHFGDGGTVPVAGYATNGYGLHDIVGNVWEWVADWYDAKYYARSPQQNPTGPDTGVKRVIRGGSWDFGPDYLRVSCRVGRDSDRGNNILGFRCARDVSQTKQEHS